MIERIGEILKNKKITIINIVVIICIALYVLDRFVFVGNATDIGEFSIKIAGKNIEDIPILVKILGLNFGKLYYIMAVPPQNEAVMKLWQPVTYLFMHQFVLHLAVNMIALYIVGNKLENEEGKVFPFLSFIIIGIIGLFITNAIVASVDAYTAGASIAVFGLIGIAVGKIIVDKSFIKKFKKGAIIYMIIYGLLFTYTSGTWTIAAHNTGLILGIITYLIYYYGYKIKLNK